jgi:hypothetical protein
MDTDYSNFYGAMLAERALSTYPSVNPEGRALLQDFMKRNLPKQPLHNKLAWIALRTDKQRDQATVTAILDKLWAKQWKDGGWTTAALGPWDPHPDAPADPGSHAYATTWAAFITRQSGVGCSVPQMKKALDWLAKHQDPETGSWRSPSMSKEYPRDSMPAKFMSDAATGFAAAALISREGQRDRPMSTASIHVYSNVEWKANETILSGPEITAQDRVGFSFR